MARVLLAGTRPRSPSNDITGFEGSVLPGIRKSEKTVSGDRGSILVRVKVEPDVFKPVDQHVNRMLRAEAEDLHALTGVGYDTRGFAVITVRGYDPNKTPEAIRCVRIAAAYLEPPTRD